MAGPAAAGLRCRVGLDRRRRPGAVAKDVADLVKRLAEVQHVDGKRVPQETGADPSLRRRNPGPFEGIGKHAPDELRRPHRTERRLQADEQVPRPAGPPVHDMVGNRLADIDRQRHAVMTPALAANRDLAGPPVDVIKPDRTDLLAAQAEPGQQKHDGAVAASGRIIAADGGDQPADLVGGKTVRRAVHAPGRDLRHARNQVPAGQPGGEHEPEQPSEIDRLLLQVRPASRLGGRKGKEGADLLRSDAVQVAGLRPEQEGQETPEEPAALGDRALAQPPLTAQPVAVVRGQPPKPVRRRRFRCRRGDRARGNEMPDKPGNAGMPAANCVP